MVEKETMEIQNNQKAMNKNITNKALRINNYPKCVYTKFTNQKAWCG